MSTSFSHLGGLSQKEEKQIYKSYLASKETIPSLMKKFVNYTIPGIRKGADNVADEVDSLQYALVGLRTGITIVKANASLQ